MHYVMRTCLAVLCGLALTATGLWAAASEEEPAAAMEKEMVMDPATGTMVTAPEYGGTITYALNQSPPTFDPLFHPWAQNAIGGVVESLAMMDWGIDRNKYGMDKVTYTPLWGKRGLLAEGWSQPDALTIILNIRQGVHWHNKAPMNGRELTASDIEYNLHRVYGLGSGWTAENKPPVLYGSAFTNLPVESVRTTDKYTVVVKLKEPLPSGGLNNFLGLESLQRTNPDLTLWPHVFRSNTAYAIETSKPPLSDIRVRKAMQMALDHETINETFYKGYGLWKPQGVIGDAVVGYSTPFEEWPEELQQEYAYSSERAEELLDEAGYPRGADGVRFKTDVVHSVVHQDVAYTELVVGYWAEIGIEVAIDAVDPATYGARVGAGHDFEGLAWHVSGIDTTDPVDGFKFFSVRGPNYTGVTDPTYEALYETALAAKTVEEQQPAVREANMYVVKNHLIIWVNIRFTGISGGSE